MKKTLSAFLALVLLMVPMIQVLAPEGSGWGKTAFSALADDLPEEVEPTLEPMPEPTPELTAVPTPELAPVSTPVPTPVPTSEPAPEADLPPEPSASPESMATLEPTATPESAKTSEPNVTVGPPAVGVTLSRATAPLHIGKTLTLTVTVAPANAANKAVTWSSSNAAVAKVSAAGVVTGVKAGTAVITVKTAEGAKTAACRVTVAQGKAAYTVTYDANGGLDAPAPQAAEHEKNIILSDAKPTRMGYSFVKWNTNQSGTGANYPSGAPYTSGETVTLYAVWKQNNTYKATLAPKFKPSKEFVSNAFGTVHAIAQSKGMASKPHPYWDANHWPTAFAGGAPAGCVLSCHCMALSSLGVPVIPKMLLEADENKNEAMVRTSDCYINSYAKVAKFAGKQAGKAIACKTVVSRAGDFNTAFASRDSNWAALNQSLANYLAQPSKYSPPIVRIFMPGNADSHSIIFIGMEADGTYRVIDPGYRCRRAVIKAPASDEISANSTAYTTIVSGIQQYVIVNRTETT